MKKFISAVAVIVATTGLMGGVAAAVPAIDETGPLSVNKIVIVDKSKCKVENTNTVNVANSSWQKAKTGKAKVVLNTTGGDATSGDAANENATTVEAQASNDASGVCDPCGCEQPQELAVTTINDGGDASISNTGPFSLNVIKVVKKSKVKVVNTNTVGVANTNTQIAKSGDALVVLNTTGGSALSGAALNQNTTGIVLTVSNN